MDYDDTRHPRFDRKYAGIPEHLLPESESLQDTVRRVVPCWTDEIAPQLLEGKKVLVVSHMNSARALVKYLSRMSEDQILNFNLPTATPLVYEFDRDLNVQRSFFDIEKDILD